MIYCWVLEEYSAVGHCRDAWWLGTAGMLCGWALQGYSASGHRRDTLLLRAAGILGGWTLQGYSAVGTALGHCRDTLPLSTAVRLRAVGEDNIDF